MVLAPGALVCWSQQETNIPMKEVTVAATLRNFINGESIAPVGTEHLDIAVWINTHILLTAEMPHGGFKHSGYGKDLSLYGVEDYTRIKHVMSALDA
jgi:Aldehyde dehydrogenase family